MKINYAQLSDIGNYRADNEDRTYAMINDYDQFLGLVADGIGGNPDGAFAAQTVIDTFAKDFEQTDFSDYDADQIKEWFADEIKVCKDAMLLAVDRAKKSERMGTTLVGLLVTDKLEVMVNVGDSRIYEIKNGDLELLTIDQNLENADDSNVYKKRLMDLIKSNTGPSGFIDRKKQITYKRALQALVSAIGPEIKATPEFEELENNTTRKFLLMSDGMYEGLDHQNSVKVLTDEDVDIQKRADDLLNEQKRIAYDNLSIVYVEVQNG